MTRENWTVQTCGQDIWIDTPIDCPTKRRDDICRIAHGSPEQRAKRIARANKIAAAPELFEALEGLLEWGRNHTSPIDPNSPHELLVAAHHAIAKAKGE